MDAPTTWQWRGWRGGRAKDTMAMSHTPVTAPAPPGHPAPCAPAPPVPAPVCAEQPAPRVVWEDPGDRTVRLVAVDWADGVAPTYSVQAAHGCSWWAAGDGTLWVPATGEEWMTMFIALAAAVDERGAGREAGGERA